MADFWIKSTTTGQLERLREAEAEARITESGGSVRYASPDEIKKFQRAQEFGTPGQTALAAVETVGRTATFGAWKGFEGSEERSEELGARQAGEALQFGAQALGAALPAIAGGAIAEAAVGAAGLAAGAARTAASVAVEGAAGGLADEFEQARIEDRPVSAGRALLSGIGGEIVGRALPAALKAGVGRIGKARDAAAAVAGEGIEDASGAAAKAARKKLAKDAYDMPPGPERDAALASTADQQVRAADSELAKASFEASELLDELARNAPSALEKELPRTAPAQLQWSADMAERLSALADQASGADAKALRRAATRLLDADDAQGIWRAAAQAREEFGEALSKAKQAAPPAPPAPPEDDLAALLGLSVEQARAAKAPVSLAGRSLDDLGALSQPESFRASTLEGLRGNAEFRRTGRVPESFDRRAHAEGIRVDLDESGAVSLADGRHRLTVAREAGAPTVWGRVYRDGEEVFRGPIPLRATDGATAAAGGIRRSARGARILDAPVSRETPPTDFSTWDLSDFSGQRNTQTSAFQRQLIEGLKSNPDFRATGRVRNDSGNLGSEPTFQISRGGTGTVRLPHGRSRIIAARELGRETVYGRVVQGSGKTQKVLYEGEIRIAGGGAPEPRPPAAPGGGASPLEQAQRFLAEGQADAAIWGRAGSGAKELNVSAQPGPSSAGRIAALEDQVKAAERWRVGAAKTREKLSEVGARMRRAQAIKDDTAKAVSAAGASGKKAGKRSRGPVSVGDVVEEGAEFLLERAVGAAVPGAGIAARIGRKVIWESLDESGRAQISRAVRGLLSPVISQGRLIGATRVSLAATALSRFAGEYPDARSAFEARREMLTHVSSHPELAGQAMAESMAELARESPSDFVRLSQRMTEALQYVAMNLPPTVAVSLAYPTGIPLTDSQLREVTDLWNASFEPGTVVDAIETGMATTTQMRTLRELHPDLHDDIRREVIMQVADNFRAVPSQRRMAIDIMFGADGIPGLWATREAARYVEQAKPEPSAKQRRTRQGGQQQMSALTPNGINAVRTGVTNRGTI